LAKIFLTPLAIK